MSDETQMRLARIEDKLDKLSEGFVLMAKLEERMLTLFNQQTRYERSYERLNERLAIVEQVTVGRGVFFRWLDRAGMAAVGAAVAVLLDNLRGGTF